LVKSYSDNKLYITNYIITVILEKRILVDFWKSSLKWEYFWNYDIEDLYILYYILYILYIIYYIYYDMYAINLLYSKIVASTSLFDSFRWCSIEHEEFLLRCWVTEGSPTAGHCSLLDYSLVGWIHILIPVFPCLRVCLLVCPSVSVLNR
jgi:hypothetical protein